ncbi:MAG: hypothetical protein ACOC80_13045 [Petrotogales bacterium]
MKNYRITYGYEDGSKNTIDIDATSKFDAMLALQRIYGKQIYVTKVEEYEYCDDKENEELTKKLDSMTKEDWKVIKGEGVSDD